jgi:hypothetical protein
MDRTSSQSQVNLSLLRSISWKIPALGGSDRRTSRETSTPQEKIIAKVFSFQIFPEDGGDAAHFANAAQHFVQLTLEILAPRAVPLLHNTALRILNADAHSA